MSIYTLQTHPISKSDRLRVFKVVIKQKNKYITVDDDYVFSNHFLIEENCKYTNSTCTIVRQFFSQLLEKEETLVEGFIHCFTTLDAAKNYISNCKKLCPDFPGSGSAYDWIYDKFFYIMECYIEPNILFWESYNGEEILAEEIITEKILKHEKDEK